MPTLGFWTVMVEGAVVVVTGGLDAEVVVVGGTDPKEKDGVDEEDPNEKVENGSEICLV